MWMGTRCGHTLFSVPVTYEIPDFYDLNDKNKLRSNGYIMKDGRLWRNLGNICWFTNLDHNKRHEELDLYKTYSPVSYPKYDNYDAIEVSKVEYIPMDYDGVMGVPITFLDKYNPEQFEIINGIGRYACLEDETTNKKGTYGTDINGKHTYFRILIRKIQ